jgi:DNA-binding beta-propeller fold protein YncE
MRHTLVVALASLGHLLTGQPAGAQIEVSPPPLTLRTRIPLPGVYGRMDHFGWDTKRGHLIVSALGNDTVEIVSQWRRIHSITGLENPQASVYLPEFDRIVVSDASGKLRFFDAETFALAGTADFGKDADTDNVRYDAKAKLVYVAYGSGRRGALAVVDPLSMQRKKEWLLGSHPESFQLEQSGTRIFVNLPDQESVAVIDRSSDVVSKWKIVGNTNSHTLALDEANHRLFIAALQPGQLRVVNADTGAVVETLPCVLGVDDLWFDAPRRRLYATGSGAIDVFQQNDPDRYSKIATIPAGEGAGSTSLHLKTRTQDSLYMAAPNLLAQGGSEVLLFYVND